MLWRSDPVSIPEMTSTVSLASVAAATTRAWREDDMHDDAYAM
jgi:hypothetical protein